MKITRRQGLGGLAAGAALAAIPAVARGQTRDIVIGAVASLTGGFAESGTRGLWGLQLAVDRINRDGGIASLGGARLRLISADTGSDHALQATEVARRAIERDETLMLYAAGASAMTLATQVEAEKAGVPLITSSYADAIVARGFQTTFKLTLQGSSLWNWSMTRIYELLREGKGGTPRSALIFMSNDAVGLAAQKQLPEHARSLNLDVVFSHSFQMGLPDPAVVIEAAVRHRADLIFLGGFADDIVRIVRAMRRAGVSAPIVGAGPCATDFVGKALGAEATRLFAPVSWHRSLAVPGNDELVAAYKAAQPDAPFPPANEHLGHGYVAGMIMRRALEQTASRDPNKLRDAIAETEFTGLPYQAGRVRFDSKGLNLHAQPLLCEWRGGELRVV